MNFLQKTSFKLIDTFLPSLSAKKIYKVMSHPRVRKLRDFEEAILDQSEKEVIRFRGFDIQTYTWGRENSKIAFLVHGWEGQAGNFGSIVDILVHAGYQVRAFDAPAHGHSSYGDTNMSEFSDLVDQLMKQYKPSLVVSHSFGSVTSVMALSRNPQLPIDKWIVVTTPHDFRDRVRQIQEFVGVADRTMKRVVGQIESDFGTSLDQMNMEFFGDKVDHVKEVVIVHSKKDKILPIDSARLTHDQLKQSQLIELDRHGHYSILWSDELKEIVRSSLN